jgi:hypothetical protein
MGDERRRGALSKIVAGYNAPRRVFISFDFDQMHFEAVALGEQLRRSPRFSVQNWSMKKAAPEPMWPDEARRRLNHCDVMVIVVNGNTFRAGGVLLEVDIARSLRVPICQVYPARTPRPARLPDPSAPANAWTHDNLERLLTVPRRTAA